MIYTINPEALADGSLILAGSIDQSDCSLHIAVSGYRGFSDDNMIWMVLSKTLSSIDFPVSPWMYVGDCRGVDAKAAYFAVSHGIPCRIFHADWDKHGKAAGPIRNKEMLSAIRDKKNRLLVAFDHPDSKGTKQCINAADEMGIPVLRIAIGG